jgi:hypothetical protein
LQSRKSLDKKKLKLKLLKEKINKKYKFHKNKNFKKIIQIKKKTKKYLSVGKSKKKIQIYNLLKISLKTIFLGLKKIKKVIF